MKAAEALSQTVPVVLACEALGVPRSSLYRERNGPPPKAEPRPRRKPPRALSDEERVAVHDILCSNELMDQTPRQAYATLLDRDEYLCSVRTMYRILDENDEVRERRNQLRHPQHVKPVLVARAPKQVWSWDITKLKGPTKRVFYYLYVILDIYSRYVPGWMIAERESEELARQLIWQSCTNQGIAPGQLTLHADRGSPMIAKTTSELLIDLGVAKSHSRPRVSNDNAYSEAQFKTVKYRPDFPDRFGSVQDARGYGGPLFQWYNNEHYHTALGLLTPAMVHYGTADKVLAKRQAVLSAAYAAHPERFVRGAPVVPALPAEVWINEPALELPTDQAGDPEDEPSYPEARNAPVPVNQPGAQAGSTAAEGRAQRSVDAGEHPATNVVIRQVEEPALLH